MNSLFNFEVFVYIIGCGFIFLFSYILISLFASGGQVLHENIYNKEKKKREQEKKLKRAG